MEQDPFGRAYRSGRFSDEETARRMLQTAVDKVNQEGLRVSFDLLRYEDVIADAGVARSAAYRRWPTKNHFYADLLLVLAGHQHPATAAYDENTVQLARRLALEGLDQLRTPPGRRALLVEIARQGALQNFTRLIQTREWSVYVTLIATLSSLPSTSLKSQLGEALGRSESGFIEKMSKFYGTMLYVLGVRPNPRIPGADMGTVAQLGGAIVEGLAMNNAALPAVQSQRFLADPFGIGVDAEWSLPSLGFTSILMTMIEADPDRDGIWSDEDLERCRELLEGLDQEVGREQSNNSEA